MIPVTKCGFYSSWGQPELLESMPGVWRTAHRQCKRLIRFDLPWADVGRMRMVSRKHPPTGDQTSFNSMYGAVALHTAKYYSEVGLCSPTTTVTHSCGHHPQKTNFCSGWKCRSGKFFTTSTNHLLQECWCSRSPPSGLIIT